MSSITLEQIRAMYPALSAATAFLDNAGGSQLPGVVIDEMTRYLRESYVQLGADYEVSRRATATVAAAHRFVKHFMNVPFEGAPGAERWGGEVILGASTSQLIFTLAQAHARVLKPGDEIIISEASHESNVGAWVNMGQPDGSRPGVMVKLWKVDPLTGEPDMAHLRSLLSPRTKLVCWPHVSNVFGHVADVAAITREVHQHGAKVLVDGVAYAPHRAVDVKAWGVDWYVYSTYKVFGPHMAALYGSNQALAPLTGPNHFFIPQSELPRKFELGGVSHEGAAGILALDHFLRDLVGLPRLRDLCAPDAAFDLSIVQRAFEIMERFETPLQDRLIAFLKTKPGVRIIGPSSTSAEVGDGNTQRVCIVSFVCKGKSSKSIALAGNALGLGFRFGNFYAYRLCQSLGLEPSDGVVRVSFCHYNSMDEADRLIRFLDAALA